MQHATAANFATGLGKFCSSWFPDFSKTTTAPKTYIFSVPRYVTPDIPPLILICILSQLQSGASDARSDDTSRLKVSVAEWLNSRTSTEMQARLSAKNKSERGICNDVTGRLLCPIDFDWDDSEYVACGTPLSLC
jgi:hypothetical protein